MFTKFSDLLWLVWATFTGGFAAGVVVLAIFTVGNDIPDGLTWVTFAMCTSAMLWYMFTESLSGVRLPYSIRLVKTKEDK